VLPRISIEYLTRTAEGQELKGIRLGVEQDEFSYAFA
jgi:type VI secretion system protein VasG